MDQLLSLKEGRRITFCYTNWNGDVGIRTAIIKGFVFGSNAYHPTPQCLLLGFDLEKNALRTFAVKDIQDVVLFQATEDTVDDLVDEWHENKIEVALHEYLGMTKTEYARWVETGELSYQGGKTDA